MNLFGGKNTDKTDLSLGKSKTLYGITVRKMPIGAYLSALARLQGLPEDFMQKCFPERSLSEILDIMSGINDESAVSIAAALFTAVPEYVVSFIAEMIGADRDKLTESPEIGMIELVDIITAFIEVNRLGELGGAVRRMISMAKSMSGTGLTGSKV